MDLTKEQLSELICKHMERENGLQDLMEMMLESMMVSDRLEYLREEGLGWAETKATAIALAGLTAWAALLLSESLVTGTATSIRAYWRFFATRRMNVKGWPALFIRKA